MKIKSFTLIELLVVIVIIGILAGVIIVSTSSSIGKANFAKAQAFSNTVQQELLLNLVSEWTFDEGNAEDTWGNNDGTLYGANGLPQLQTKENCVYGTCYLFDGVDDYIVANNMLNGKTQATFSVWMKKSAIDKQISIGENINTYTNSRIELIWFTNGYIYYEIGPNDGTWVRSLASNNDTNWHHLVGVYNGNGGSTNYDKIKIYFDGVLLPLQSQSGTTSPSISTTGNFYIGFRGAYSSGSIDDVRIYDAVLSSSQIKQNYIAGLNSLLANNNISKEEYNQRLNNLAYDKE
ncbi:MAG: prepilin-type N-terminal cleavage/methylation domain-containing protein [Clostridia bacterium]|nr:prepilin-type N-terminal cleavage/methylation domain-containing protein [Clostridia bacterium]